MPRHSSEWRVLRVLYQHRADGGMYGSDIGPLTGLWFWRSRIYGILGRLFDHGHVRVEVDELKPSAEDYTRRSKYVITEAGISWLYR